MATTVYFEEVLSNDATKAKFKLELGRAWGEAGDDMYLAVNSKPIILDPATARRLVAAIESLGRYYAWLK